MTAQRGYRLPDQGRPGLLEGGCGESGGFFWDLIAERR